MPEIDLGRGYDLYLADLFGFLSKRPMRFLAMKKTLEARAIPVVVWNRDAPWNCAIKPWRKPWIRLLGLVDIYLAHSLQGAEDFAANWHYFPNAAETGTYHLNGATFEDLRNPALYRTDVAFYGSLSPSYARVGPRVEFMNALKTRLRSAGISVDIRDACPGPEQMSPAAQIEQIQTSRINLNVGAVCDDRQASWGLPERCFGVPACGGFLLCDYRHHALDTFSAQAWADFVDLDDCVRAIRYYLDHFSETRRKAELLHAETIARHTYRQRAATVLALAEAWKRVRR
ncbi:MAG TPA: glycosyltransferase [Burkholderiales bacterium]|nr:glycosyltransferase [Burkholderiales bacterium]